MLLTKAVSVLVSSVSAPSVSIQAVFKIITPKKIVTHEQVPNNARVFSCCFMNEIKDLRINKVNEKSRLIVQAYTNNKKLVRT